MFRLPTRRRALAALPALALIALAACSDSSGPGDSWAGEGGHVPSSVQGDWKFGTISMISFWDDHTGDYLGTAGGVAVFFEFEPNGTYKHYVYVLVRNYGCVTQSWTEMRGTVDFSETTFLATPKQGKFKASDNCNDRYNFQRAMTSAELAERRREYLWKFEQNPNDGKTYLMVGHDAQTWSHFQRQ